MDFLEIVVDTRERAVIPFFEESSSEISFRVDQVNVGDYSVLYRGYILFIIERKTWGDLSDSLRDGRSKNVKKMMKVRDETGCHLIYLIEGPAFPKRTKRFNRMPMSNLRAHLDHLAFRDGIHMSYSKNQQDTVVRIHELVKNYVSIKPSPLSIIDDLIYKEAQEAKESNETGIEGTVVSNVLASNTGGNSGKLKEKSPIVPSDVIYKIWCCVPNITDRSASIFIDAGYHISDLILGRITKETIYSMRYANGCIIGKRSDKIINGSKISPINVKYYVKMLSQINGLTKDTATLILETFDFKNILMGSVTQNHLESFNKTPNRKLGKKLSTEIVKYFTFINPETEQSVE
jgi:ERCC4-type nuclease